MISTPFTTKWIVTGIEKMIKSLLKSRSLLAVCLTVVLGCTSNQDSTAADTSPWKQEIKCGDTRFQITSECQTLDGKSELNTCKRQTLTQLDTGKTTVLPNPSKGDAIGIAKAGNTGRLFVTSWMCMMKGPDQYLHLDYNTGTGRSQYDEYYESYDKSLVPLHLSNKKLADELVTKALGRKSISVKSIMPLNEGE